MFIHVHLTNDFDEELSVVRKRYREKKNHFWMPQGSKCDRLCQHLTNELNLRINEMGRLGTLHRSIV